jgi:hypothetical protein
MKIGMGQKEMKRHLANEDELILPSERPDVMRRCSWVVGKASESTLICAAVVIQLFTSVTEVRT